MSDLKYFLKDNKIGRENVFYPATKSLTDEEGAVKWEIRALTTEEDERIREESIKRDKNTPRLDYSLYMKKMAVASVVFPPLYNASLQDSYSVKTPEELLVKLIDSPGEYQNFIRFIQKLNGFDVTMEKRVDEAKN